MHRGSSASKVYRSLAEMPQAVRALMLSPQVLIIAKTILNQLFIVVLILTILVLNGLMLRAN